MPTRWSLMGRPNKMHFPFFSFAVLFYTTSFLFRLSFSFFHSSVFLILYFNFLDFLCRLLLFSSFLILFFILLHKYIFCFIFLFNKYMNVLNCMKKTSQIAKKFNIIVISFIFILFANLFCF